MNKSSERLDIAAEYKSLVSQQEQTYERQLQEAELIKNKVRASIDHNLQVEDYYR